MKRVNISNGTPKEYSNCYVRLERMDNIERYTRAVRPNPETSGFYLIDSSSEELNSQAGLLSLNFMSNLLNDYGRLFRSYVLLERLSPQDIQNLMNKKE